MIAIENISRIYQTANGPVKALDQFSLNIDKGEFVVLKGASGSGKTTLLMMLGAMLTPTSGTIRFDRTDLACAVEGQDRLTSLQALEHNFLQSVDDQHRTPQISFLSA